MKNFKFGDIVYGRYEGEEFWEEAEFLKYDENLEYGKYVCLTWTHDGKTVDCFDEIKEKDNLKVGDKVEIIEDVCEEGRVIEKGEVGKIDYSSVNFVDIILKDGNIYNINKKYVRLIEEN